jgi:hypothetical protein
MTDAAAVVDSPAKVCPLLVGVAIPQVTLQTVDGKPFDLNRAVSERPSALVFYRGGW